jgi:S1-C subfamily serine protease
VRDLMFVLREAVPGQKGKVTVVRDGKRVTVDVVFGKSHRRAR